ncbi:unnamed protein product, partial [Didymodactylos carnosus]
GSIEHQSIIDSNLSDMVVFNFMDKITVGGRIGDVTVNFCTLPISDQPEIKLYVLQPRPDDPRAFTVIEWLDRDHYVVPVENLNRIRDYSPVGKQNGVHTIATNTDIPVLAGQYLAISFGFGAGSPYSVERNEYSVNIKHFQTALKQKKSVLFTNYPNKGAAFSFNVVQTDTYGNQIPPEAVRNSNANMMELTVQYPGSESVKSSDRHSRQRRSSGSFEMTNKFQERDNVLRESSIAEDYWKQIIESIKKGEQNEQREDT